MKTTDTRSRIAIQNILFTTDFSQAATTAAPFAATLAKYFGAKIRVLHVSTPVVNPMTPPETWASLEDAAVVRAREQRDAVREQFSGLEPNILIEEGDLWNHLAAAVEREHIDLIVCGTRGRSGLQKLVLGSTAEKIFREAPCAVFTVGPRVHARAPGRREIPEILYATDFGPAAAAAAPYAISLAQEYQARLTLLHVLPEFDMKRHLNYEEIESSCQDELRSIVPPGAEPWCEPSWTVKQGDPAEKILETAADRNASLIVLGVRRASGVPGAATHLEIATAHKVVSQATCPVLTVPESRTKTAMRGDPEPCCT